MVDAQGDVCDLPGLCGEAVDDLHLLDRLAVYGQNPLLDGVPELLVAFPDAGIDDAFGLESGLNGLLEFVSRGAVDSESVLADDCEQVVVVVCLDGVVNLVPVLVGFVHDAFEGLAQQGRVVEIEGGFVSPELGCDLSA